MKYTTIITQDHAFISLNHRHETRNFYHITNTKPHFSVISQTKDFTFLSQIYTTMIQTQFLLSSKIILFYPNMETRFTYNNNDTGPHFLITYRYMTHIVTTKITQDYMILSNHWHKTHKTRQVYTQQWVIDLKKKKKTTTVTQDRTFLSYHRHKTSYFVWEPH